MNISGVVNLDGSVDLTGKQGSTWELILELKQPNGQPMKLEGYSVRSQIRKNYSAQEITKAFVCTILTPSTDGKIKIYLSAGETAAITCGKSPKNSESTYVYDIEIESAEGGVSRILEGKLYVDPEVTK